jgi:hypothetical protein
LQLLINVGGTHSVYIALTQGFSDSGPPLLIIRATKAGFDAQHKSSFFGLMILHNGGFISVERE